MKQYDYLIVGAGLYGAVFAQEAKKAGKKCLVIEYALLVFYDEPQIGGASGGTQAGPIFAAIMEEVLPYLGVDPQYTEFAPINVIFYISKQ